MRYAKKFVRFRYNSCTVLVLIRAIILFLKAKEILEMAQKKHANEFCVLFFGDPAGRILISSNYLTINLLRQVSFDARSNYALQFLSTN